MTDILIIVCIILCILNAIFLIALLLKKRKEGEGAAMEKLRKMEEKTDAVGKLADYNARTLERLERSTEARLVNIQNRLTDDIKYVVDVNAQNLERIRRTVDDKLTSSIDGKLSDQLVGIAHPHLHTPELPLRQIAVVISAAAAHARPLRGKGRAGNHDQIDLRGRAADGPGPRFADSESSVAQRFGHIFEELHPLAFDARHDKPLALRQPPCDRRLRRGFIGQSAEKGHRTGGRKCGQLLHPGKDLPRPLRTCFGRQRKIAPFHLPAQFVFRHKTLLSNAKFPFVSIVITQTMAIFALRKHKSLTKITNLNHYELFSI